MKNLLFLFFLLISALNARSQNFCLEEGFEGLTTGPLTSTVWIGSNAPSNVSIICPTSNINYTSGANVVVLNTPFIDPLCGNVAASPFPGNNITRISTNVTNNIRTKLEQTFTVSPSNFIFRYAYKGIFNATAYANCMTGSLIFRFYDCNNNMLSAVSKTIANTFGGLTLDANHWVIPSPTSLSSPAHTPNWVVHEINLSAYIGSCVRFEAITSPMTAGGWMTYCYFDNQCSSRFLYGNNSFLTVDNFSACATATLAGMQGFGTYSWQGPPLSGVSGSTLSSIIATVSGIYTLSTSTGTNAFTQTVNLTLIQPSPIAVTGNTTICAGQSTTLQASLAGVTTFSWNNTSSNNASIVATPFNSTVYSVAATNTNGCISQNSIQINVNPSPQLLFNSPGTICQGESASLSIPGNLTSYLWNTGSSAASITVSPSVTSIYSATVSNNFGCFTNAQITLTVLPVSNLTLAASSPTICSGQSVALSASLIAATSYSWNNMSSVPNITVTPTSSTVYIGSATNNFGCSKQASISIVVHPVANAAIVASNTHVCIGESVTLTASASGNISYDWKNGITTNSLAVSPTINTTYTLEVTTINGCKAENTFLIPVYANPTVNVLASKLKICSGESVKLTAVSADAIMYAWSSESIASASNTVTVTPTSNTTYTVIVSDINNCKTAAQRSIEVLDCTGISKHEKIANFVSVFPNPSNKNFTIRSEVETELFIYNQVGQLLDSFVFEKSNNYTIVISDLKPGVYYLSNKERSWNHKIAVY